MLFISDVNMKSGECESAPLWDRMPSSTFEVLEGARIKLSSGMLEFVINCVLNLKWLTPNVLEDIVFIEISPKKV